MLPHAAAPSTSSPSAPLPGAAAAAASSLSASSPSASSTSAPLPGAAAAAASNTLYPLRSCVWEITLACCFTCQHCGSRAGRARENELTTAECLSVASQLADLGCKRVSLIGGEVFLRPDWETIASALSARGIAVNVITNGFAFSRALLDALQRVRVESVSVSLDGTRAIHDSIRAPGSYDRALSAISALHSAHIPVSVITTLNSTNVTCLDEMYEELSRLPLFAWQLQACSPMGNAQGNNLDYRFSMRDVITFVERRLAHAPFALGVADNIGYFTKSEGFIRGNTSGRAVFRGCGAGLTGIGIDSVGNVRGCESMYDERFVEGNLRERSLADIWNDPNAFAYNRAFTPDLLQGACATCEHGSRCAAGCRSYNYFTHGRLYESPHCAHSEDNLLLERRIND